MLVDYSAFRGPAVALGIVLIVLLLVSVIAVVRSQRRPPVAGREAIVGGTAVAQSALDPTGSVLFEGELWRARSPKSRIEAGEEVAITAVRGLTLTVKKKEVTDD